MAMYFNVYICILYNDVMRCHKDTVMLRSTTGPYDQPVIEVAYGETLFSLYCDCMGENTGKVVGVSTCCIAHARHTRVNTSVGSIILFLVFMISKSTCIMFFFFKIYIYIYVYCIKEHWWSLTSSWPNEVQRMFSTAHGFSKENLNHRQFYEHFI